MARPARAALVARMEVGKAEVMSRQRFHVRGVRGTVVCSSPQKPVQNRTKKQIVDAWSTGLGGNLGADARASHGGADRGRPRSTASRDRYSSADHGLACCTVSGRQCGGDEIVPQERVVESIQKSWKFSDRGALLCARKTLEK